MKNIQKFDYELLDIFSEFADAFADYLGLRVTKILGTGQNGVAFLTNRLTVIKVTQSITEAVYASRLVNVKPTHIGIVYEVVSIGSLSGIHQELVKLCTFQDKAAYEAIKEPLKETITVGTGGNSLEVNLGMFKSESDEYRMLEQIYSAIYELNSLGISSIALNINEIGYSRSGYVLFGLSDPTNELSKYQEAYKQLCHDSPTIKIRRVI